MKKNWIALLCAGALAGPGLAFSALDHDHHKGDEAESQEEGPKKLKVGSEVPETLALPDFQGNEHTFKGMRDKVVVLHFWSDRCPWEEHANPIFLEMEKKFAENKDVVMVGIASNQNELGPKPGADADYSTLYTSLRKKAEKVGYKHLILADHGNVVSDLFQARSTPHCYVIDKKGVLQYAGALDNDPRDQKGDEAVNYVVDAAMAVLKGEKPEVTETKPYG